MQPNASHIAHLFFLAQTGKLSALEQDEWDAFIAAYPEQAAYLESLEETDFLQQEFSERGLSNEQERTERMLEEIRRKLSASPPSLVRPVHRVHFLKTAWFRYAAAIVLLLSGVAYYYSSNRPVESLITQTKGVSASNNILPGSSKAILTLSDGRKVELDSVSASSYIADGDAGIASDEGALTYMGGQVAVMNSMTTPKGGQYRIQLADGTQVWLNAASSITYPTAFTGKTREVKVTGEVYFEVKANKEKPFIVNTASDKITVLGTSFNVNAYPDEESVKTTLLEGAVHVNDMNIKPGQAYQQGKVVSTNVKQDVAWKNGYFDFDNANWASALRQLARWYNIEIKIEGKLPTATLKGEIGRDLTLGQVLDLLAESGLKTALKGNILTVLP